MRLKKLLLSAIIMTFSGLLSAQTTLSQGDMAILSIDGDNSSNRRFTWVPLVDIEGGTVIYFTDEASDGTTTHPDATSGARGKTIYTAPAGGVKAGTVIGWAISSANSGAEWQPSLDGDGDIRINAQDKLIAFQGTDEDSPSAYLFAIGNAASYGPFDPSYSMTSTVDMGTDGQCVYNGNRNSTQSDLFTDLLNYSNYTGVASGGITDNFTEFRIGYYWDGSTWTPSDPGGVGSAFDDNVIIAASGATFSGNVETNNDVIIDAAATLDVGANTLTADSVIIYSDATGQGQVVGSVTANVEFQSYISGSAGWFNVGSPVDGALSKITITNGGVIRTDADGPTANANVYFYDETTDNAGEGTWTVAADQTPLANANGWSIYLGGGGAFGTLPMTISTFGNLDADGVVSKSITATTAGWNFVNNPYAATLDWEDLLTRNTGEIGTTYFIYDDNTDGWRGYNTGAGSLPGGVTAVTRYISAGQAFFVEALSATTLDFDDADVDMTGSTDLYRSVPNPGVYLVVTTSSNAFDYAYMGLKNGAVMGYDLAIDARKKFNNSAVTPNISTAVNGEEFMFNFVENSTGSISMPVNLVYGLDDELTITPDIRNIDVSTSVMLEDKLSGDMIDLRQGAYTFRHVSGNAPDRFVLHLSPNNSVGVDESAISGDAIFAYTENQILFVNLETLTEDASIQLYDMSGKLVLSQNVIAGQIAEVNLPSAGSGVYLLEVMVNGQAVYTQKIMK